MKINKKLSIVLTVLLLVPLFFVIASAIRTSSKSAELIATEQEIAEVYEQNKLLKGKIITDTSLTKLRDQIDKNVYKSPETTIYLSKETEVAQLP